MLTVWGIGFHMAKHGQRRKEKYNGWNSLIAGLIEIALIVWAIKWGF